MFNATAFTEMLKELNFSKAEIIDFYEGILKEANPMNYNKIIEMYTDPNRVEEVLKTSFFYESAGWVYYVNGFHEYPVMTYNGAIKLHKDWMLFGLCIDEDDRIVKTANEMLKALGIKLKPEDVRSLHEAKMYELFDFYVHRTDTNTFWEVKGDLSCPFPKDNECGDAFSAHAGLFDTNRFKIYLDKPTEKAEYPYDTETAKEKYLIGYKVKTLNKMIGIVSSDKKAYVSGFGRGKDSEYSWKITGKRPLSFEDACMKCFKYNTIYHSEDKEVTLVNRNDSLFIRHKDGRGMNVTADILSAKYFIKD